MYFPALNASVSVCILDRNKRGLRRNVLESISKTLLVHDKKQISKNKSISEYLNKITDFSGTILIGHNDSVIEHRAYGMANIEHKVKNNLDTKFNLASISKLITSIGVLQLVEQGKIDLNETVGTYLPDYSNTLVRDSVTIHHLLTHTSGVPPFYDDDFITSDKMKYKIVDDFLTLFEGDSLNFRPSDRYQYSGSGFILLGKIIEEISDMDYYSYIDNLVFKKAGMHNSLSIPTDSIVSNKSDGYTCLWGDQAYYSRNDYYISMASPAGFHYSTSNDLFLFLRALRNGTLINEASKTLLTTPKVKGYNTHIGYGIDIDLRYNELIIGHSGGWFGIRTEIMDFMASGYTIVVLSNKDDNGKSGASKVIDDLKRIIAGERKI